MPAAACRSRPARTTGSPSAGSPSTRACAGWPPRRGPGASASESIEDSVLRVERTETAVPDGAADLVADLYRRLPEARITDILLEVDDATRFTEAFTHLRTGEPCRDRIGLLNVLLAEGINLGLRKMAEATNTHEVLGVDAHRPGTWKATRSTERWPSSARPRPRYRWPPSGVPGGPPPAMASSSWPPAGARPSTWSEPGVKAYSHVSDRFSPFATQTIPATVHEAPYILDRLLMNETGRGIREQYADTGGFTDYAFAACSILRLLVRPAHPGPALEAPLRVRTRGRPEAPAPVGRRQGERGPDRPELGGHPAGGVHHGGRDHAAEPAPAQARRVSAPERAGGGAAGSRPHRDAGASRRSSPG